jgi:hypothetical protein
VYRPPGVNIKVAGCAVQSFIGPFNQSFHERGAASEVRGLWRFWRQRSLQYFTSSHTFSHFFRQVNGRLQAMQIFCGKCGFLCAMLRKQAGG